MRLILDAIWFLAALGVVEALIKPVVKQLVQRQVLRAAPLLLQHLDQNFPQWVGECSGAELENRVRQLAEELTGEDWSNVNLDPLWQRFDPRVTAERHARP
jgi:hypothetical protein